MKSDAAPYVTPSDAQPAPAPDVPVSVLAHPAVAGLIHSMPSPSEEWPAQYRADWIDAMSKVLTLIWGAE